MELEYHKPGVYLDMPEAEYRADPSLGSSDLKRLLVSPLTYWIHSRHNPNRQDDEPSDSMAYGTAMHVRILLGREEFYRRYAPKLSQADYPEHLKSGDELAARCAELGVAKSGTLAERAARIKAKDPDAKLWVDVQAEWDEEHDGCEPIPAVWIANIELAAHSLESDASTAALLSGGKPEVSLFWRDPEHDTPLKARMDYVQDGENPYILDLKTFANQAGKPLETAVAHAAATYQYGVQALSYSSGLAVLKGRKLEDIDFTFLFVNSGPVPNVLVRDFAAVVGGEKQCYWQTAHDSFRAAVRCYANCVKRYGLDRQWVEPAVREPLCDEQFPLWSL